MLIPAAYAALKQRPHKATSHTTSNPTRWLRCENEGCCIQLPRAAWQHPACDQGLPWWIRLQLGRHLQAARGRLVPSQLRRGHQPVEQARAPPKLQASGILLRGRRERGFIRCHAYIHEGGCGAALRLAGGAQGGGDGHEARRHRGVQGAAPERQGGKLHIAVLKLAPSHRLPAPTLGTPYLQIVFCHVHVERNLTTASKSNRALFNNIKNLGKLKFYARLIFQCRTDATATAVANLVQHWMRAEGELRAADWFWREYCCPDRLRWHHRASGVAGVYSATNPQESWHRSIKQAITMNQRVNTGAMLADVFPMLLASDGQKSLDGVSLEPQDRAPSKMVEDAVKMWEAKACRGSLDAGEFFVTESLPEGVEKTVEVTDRWVRSYKEGLLGNIEATATAQRVKATYLGLVRVTSSGGRVSECDCPIYSLRLCCPHSLVVGRLLGRVDFPSLSAAVGRVSRWNRKHAVGALTRQPPDGGRQ